MKNQYPKDMLRLRVNKEETPDIPPRRVAKRPVGRKLRIDSIMVNKEPEIIFENVDPWSFSSLKQFLDSFLSPNGSADISLYEALHENIDFFQKLKIELKKKHKNFEVQFALPKSQTASQRSVPAPRFILSRSASSAVHLPQEEKPKAPLKHTTRATRERDPDHVPQKPYTSNSIWNSVYRFFSTVPTYDQFKKYLEVIDDKPEQVELGQHYSITFNEKLKQKFKSDAILLKVPENAVQPTGKFGNVPIVSFRRVVAALVPIVDDKKLTEQQKEADNEGTTNSYQQVQFVDPQSQQRMNQLADFEIDDYSKNLNPTNLFGTSHYSRLNFEEKLSLEVASLGLDPTSGGPCEIDNEIMEEIISLQQEYKKSVESINTLRETISKKLIEEHDKLVERNEKAKKWTQMVEKAEKEAKEKKRPKSRDKLT